MKANTETTKAERLRVVVGWTLVVLGVATIVFIGALYGYEKTTVWVAGGLLIISGVLIAKSVALANFLNDILRF